MRQLLPRAEAGTIEFRWARVENRLVWEPVELRYGEDGLPFKIRLIDLHRKDDFPASWVVEWGALLRPGDEPLSSARERFRKGLIPRKGTQCPLCTRHCEIYERRVNAGIVRGMEWIAQRSAELKAAGGSGYVNVPEEADREKPERAVVKIVKSNQHTTLRWWGLLERPPKTEDEYEGLWRPTEKGFAFLRGEVPIHAIAFVYHGEAISFSDELVYVDDCRRDVERSRTKRKRRPPRTAESMNLPEDFMR